MTSHSWRVYTLNGFVAAPHINLTLKIFIEKVFCGGVQILFYITVQDLYNSNMMSDAKDRTRKSLYNQELFLNQIRKIFAPFECFYKVILRSKKVILIQTLYYYQT